MKKGLSIVFVIIILIGLFIYYISNVTRRMSDDSKKDAVEISKIIPDDYEKLLRKSEKLFFDQTIISKQRNPISQFDYDNKFHISIYKIGTASNLPLSNIIDETYLNTHITYNLTYNLCDNLDQFEILCKSGSPGKLSKIYLNIFGSDTRIVTKTDTTACYYSMAESFFIKYQPNGPQDFFGRVKEKYNGAKIPIELMFVKREGNLYVILLAANNGHTALDSKTVLNLVN